MKKRKKIILWIAVIVLVLCSITALSIKPDIDASGKDLFLYRMSGFSLFLIWLFGLIIELDVFHIKKNILRIGIDQHNLIAEFSQCLARLCSRIIELTRLSDNDWTGTDNQYFVNVISPHVFSLSLSAVFWL